MGLKDFFRKKTTPEQPSTQETPAGAICPHCRRPCPALDGIGPFCAITEANVTDLIILFKGGYDEGRCDECGKGIGIQPTVMILYGNPRELHVAPGTLLARDPDMADHVFRVAGMAFPGAGGAIPVEWFDSLDPLREAFGTRAIVTFEHFNGLLIDGHGDAMEGYLRKHWHEFTPGVFGVGHLAITGLVPGVRMRVQLADGSLAPEKHLREIFSYAQAWVWKIMCETAAVLALSDTEEFEFERLLHTFTDTPFVIPRAHELFYSETASTDLSQIPLGSLTTPQVAYLYCMEATNAWLCHLSRRENPRATFWTSIYYAVEMGARRGSEELSKPFGRLLLSDERVAAITPKESARVAIAGMFPEPPHSPERLEVLEAISAKAGHPGVAREALSA